MPGSQSSHLAWSIKRVGDPKIPRSPNPPPSAEPEGKSQEGVYSGALKRAVICKPRSESCRNESTGVTLLWRRRRCRPFEIRHEARAAFALPKWSRHFRSHCARLAPCTRRRSDKHLGYKECRVATSIHRNSGDSV